MSAQPFQQQQQQQQQPMMMAQQPYQQQPYQQQPYQQQQQPMMMQQQQPMMMQQPMQQQPMMQQQQQPQYYQQQPQMMQPQQPQMAVMQPQQTQMQPQMQMHAQPAPLFIAPQQQQQQQVQTAPMGVSVSPPSVSTYPASPSNAGGVLADGSPAPVAVALTETAAFPEIAPKSTCRFAEGARMRVLYSSRLSPEAGNLQWSPRQLMAGGPSAVFCCRPYCHNEKWDNIKNRGYIRIMENRCDNSETPARRGGQLRASRRDNEPSRTRRPAGCGCRRSLDCI